MDYLLSSVAAVLTTPETLWVVLIVMFALFTRAAFGFGDGVIAVPLLSLMMDLSEAVPLVLFLSTIMSFVALWKERQHVQFGSLKRTAVMALLGFPLGVALLGLGNDDIVKALLGVVLIALAFWNLSPAKKIRLRASGWSYVFGLAAGILGGAYAFRGIVFSIYGGLRGWSPSQFKATIHSFYLVSGILIPFAYVGAGLVTPRVLGSFIVLLPLAFAATLLGAWSTGRLHPEVFRKTIWSLLSILGAIFVLQFLLQGGVREIGMT